MVTVSIIIVNYNTPDLTTACLNSIIEHCQSQSYEIILVDNGSQDDSVNKLRKKFSEITIIANPQNVGFAKANNQALRIATGSYLWLLNSDTTINQDTLPTLLSAFKKYPHLAVVSPKVLLPSGQIDPACRRLFPTIWNSFTYLSGLSKLFPKSKLFSRYHLTYLDENQETKVDAVSGACMLLSRKPLEKVGYLDQQFFMYGEDIDWCYRFKQHGFDILYYPKSTIIHYKSASSQGRKNPKIIYEFHRAMWLFYKKHYASKHWYFTNLLMKMSIWSHYYLDITKK